MNFPELSEHRPQIQVKRQRAATTEWGGARKFMQLESRAYATFASQAPFFRILLIRLNSSCNYGKCLLFCINTETMLFPLSL